MLIPIILDFKPWISQEAGKKSPSQMKMEKPLRDSWSRPHSAGAGGIQHKQRQLLIKVGLSLPDSELSDMSGNSSLCKLLVTDPNLSVFNISYNLSAEIPCGFSPLKEVGAWWQGLEEVWL